MTGKAPAFQFYPKDFLTDELVISMSNEEVGVYIKMLCADWLNDGLPGDPARLCRMFQCDEHTLNICCESFTERDGRLFNNRLNREREKQLDRREQMSAAGRASAKARRSKALDDPTSVEHTLNIRSTSVEHKGNSSSSSSSSKESPIVPKGTVYTVEFERFWSAYPRRVGKRVAFTAFKRANKRADYAEIMAGITTSPATTHDDPQFVPHASTWLNRDGWEDEPTQQQYHMKIGGIEDA